MALLTLAQARKALNVQNPNATLDVEITRWIGAVSDVIVSVLNQPVEAGERQYEFEGTGQRRKFLPFAPIAAITGLEWRYSSFEEYETVLTAYYALVTRDGVSFIEIRDDIFMKHVQYRVTLTSGYDTVPAPIIQVVVEMLQILWRESKHGENLLAVANVATSLQGASATTSYRDLSDKWAEQLRPYRLPTV